MGQDPRTRFESKFDRGGPEECWLWKGHRCHRYGGFKYGESGKYAHRAAYEFYVRKLEPGEVIHHLCEVKICVNPAHLVAISDSAHKRLHNRDACSICGSTRRSQRYRDGKPNGHRCLDCHKRRENERYRGSRIVHT